MSGTCFLGIDPGLKGGLALLSERDGLLLEPMPTVGGELDLAELARLLRDWAPDIRIAYLERVHAMPKQGVSSMFTFGTAFGSVRAMLAAFQIPYELVLPRRWQIEMHAAVKPSLDSKQKSQLAFKRLFPGVNALATDRSRVAHEGMVEAALIAEFARRSHGGRP